MPPNDILTDDYVAQMLSKDASDFSLKYSSMGLEASSATSKRPANQPKPNTRFLNNIIRDTKSHNRALLAKESAESQARLKRLELADEEKRKEEEQRRRRLNPGPRDTRKRILGDINSHLGSAPSRKTRDRDAHRSDAREHQRRAIGNSSRSENGSQGKRRREESHEDLETESSLSKKKLKRSSEDRGRRSSHHRTKDRRDRSTSRSRSGSRDRKQRSRTHERRIKSKRGERDDDKRSSSKRTSEHTSEDLFDKVPKKDLFSGHKGQSGKSYRLPAPSPSPEVFDSDSDPLEDIIGPSLPGSSRVRARGRGKTSTASGIDSRFAEDYDPTTDVSREASTADDWDNALEMHRDRQKLKSQNAARLRSAGFTDKEIRHSKNGAMEKTEEDVVWGKKGEEREWDKGKGET